jgi:DNA adenine methylase Dam
MRPIITYVGGKYRYGKKLDALGLLPKEIDNYYELFCGGTGMMCYLKNTRNIKKLYLSDLDTMLINMYQQIQKNDIDTFLNMFNALKVDKETFKQCVELLDTDYTNDIYCAVAYFYIKRTSYGGIIKHKQNGLLKTNFYKDGIRNKIIGETVSIFKNGITDVFFNCVSFTDTSIDNKENTFVFLDPPYLCEKKFYIHDTQFIDELLVLCDTLHKNKIRWCLTFNMNTDIQEKFKSYIITPLKFTIVSFSKNKDTMEEILITNYRPNTLELLE